MREPFSLALVSADFQYVDRLVSISAGLPNNPLASPDPTRWALIISPMTTGGFVTPVSDRGTGVGISVSNAQQGGNPLVIDFPTWGSIVQAAWYGRQTGGASNWWVSEILYRPAAHEFVDKGGI